MGDAGRGLLAPQVQGDMGDGAPGHNPRVAGSAVVGRIHHHQCRAGDGQTLGQLVQQGQQRCGVRRLGRSAREVQGERIGGGPPLGGAYSPTTSTSRPALCQGPWSLWPTNWRWGPQSGCGARRARKRLKVAALGTRRLPSPHTSFVGPSPEDRAKRPIFLNETVATPPTRAGRTISARPRFWQCDTMWGDCCRTLIPYLVARVFGVLALP